MFEDNIFAAIADGTLFNQQDDAGVMPFMPSPLPSSSSQLSCSSDITQRP